MCDPADDLCWNDNESPLKRVLISLFLLVFLACVGVAHAGCNLPNTDTGTQLINDLNACISSVIIGGPPPSDISMGGFNLKSLGQAVATGDALAWNKNIQGNVNGEKNPLTFSGVDIGAQINNAIAALGVAGGVVRIPAGTYSFSTTIQCPKTNTGQIWIKGTGRNGDVTLVSAAGGTVLNYTGSSDAINDVATTNGAVGCGIDNILLDGSSAGAAATGFHFGNTSLTELSHSTIQQFSGTTASAVKVENSSGMWTERWRIGNHSALPLNKTDIALVCASGCADSEAHHDVDALVNVISGQTFMNVGAGITYYGGRTTVQGNFFTGSTVFAVNGAISSEALTNLAEQSTPGVVMFNIASGSAVDASGYLLDNGPTNTLAGNAGRPVLGSDSIGGANFRYAGIIESNFAGITSTKNSYAQYLGIFDPTNTASNIAFGNAAGTTQWFINGGFGAAGAQGNLAIVDQVNGVFPIIVHPTAAQTDFTNTGLNAHAFGFATIYTNGTKPAASGNNHYRICVSDAAACTSGTTYAGGGGTACELWSDGANWKESGSGC